MEIKVTPSFTRSIKKLHERDKLTLDDAINDIVKNPYIGSQKKGDLSKILVHKFKINKQEVLLVYKKLEPSRDNPEVLVLVLLGTHENFYRELKQ
ncbi:type II toxin-antitoxin system RelE/ParE family toxin [Undibacterium sp. WLX3042]|uniref:type II toxin-antitoxin system RelE/ParE family toxin n=1 Tax=Undibacterium sp. WLX3042 TaxID=3412686 RepID=UPI003C2E648C